MLTEILQGNHVLLMRVVNTLKKLYCCDCNLRHLVVVEAVGKGADKFKSEDGKIAIAMARDSKATEIARKRDKIVLYQRNDRKKDAKTKKA